MRACFTLTAWPDAAARCWLVRSTDPEVVALFGTDTLPMPYLHTAPAETVRAALAARNPDARVLIIRGEAVAS